MQWNKHIRILMQPLALHCIQVFASDATRVQTQTDCSGWICFMIDGEKNVVCDALVFFVVMVTAHCQEKRETRGGD